ncbi:SH3 domain-containing protein [Amycolatopsis sp. NPDC021455]|uniref:SH3 domain-containing protein n=1 Tax=Amycolatopsis sp. NPDC021455 TaxID=3154901 RepID=UPI0033FE35EB
MPTVAVVLGSTGAVLLLAALIGRGLTIGDIALPAVSMLARIPCFVVGGVLIALSVLLTVVELAGPPADAGPGPASQPPVPLAAGTVMTPADVHLAPSLSSSIVGQLDTGVTVEILCTAQGEIVRTPDGHTSGLWDMTGAGFVPDVVIDTGTDQATTGPC